MKKNEVKIGEVYVAKVSDRLTEVRIDSTHTHGGWNATNIRTGKRIRVKSAQRLRCRAAAAEAARQVASRRRARPDAEPMPADPGCGAAASALGAETRPEVEGAAATRDGASRPADRDPATPPARSRREKKSAGELPPKKLSALTAAVQVLADAGRPLRVKEMIAAMAERGLWSSPNGKTPEATLYSIIIREIKVKGQAARFRKTERGHFIATK